jgi:ABC-type multidrug transport system fused ATPase/permease subunit
VLLVRHRCSAVTHADRVVVFGHGRIVRQGRPEELIETPGPFRDFVEARLSSPGQPAATPT